MEKSEKIQAEKEDGPMGAGVRVVQTARLREEFYLHHEDGRHPVPDSELEESSDVAFCPHESLISIS
jgi:hypothetical protein